jgi:TIR domain
MQFGCGGFGHDEMAFDTFISYSSKDKTAADAVCAMLESAGVRCWIAPRDITPGVEYGAAIVDAIDQCRVMVLIFSANANSSGQILREVERAVSKGVPIVPVRIEGVLPTKSMEYFLGSIHWLDALTPPLENHLRQLVTTVRAILGNPTDRGNAAPAPMARSAGSKRTALIASLGVAMVALLAGGLWFYQTRPSSAPVARSPSAPAPRPPQVEALIPETVPFVSDRDRASIRTDYLTAPDHKAIAISGRAGFVTGQPSEEAARLGALTACQRISEKSSRKCELYAVGTVVVLAPSQPPMPPAPWIVRNPAIERPLVVNQVPLLSPSTRPEFERYLAGPVPKALAISTRGFGYVIGQESVDEAVRRALELCASHSNIACLVLAIDNVFVVAVPATMKPIGAFRAMTEASIAPDARGIVASRLANAADGWSAVAVGANGRPGLMLRAANERAAIEGALADCSKLDQNCRVIAIGPFLVAPSASGN